VNVCVPTPHAVDVTAPAEHSNYGFADCAATLDVTAAAFSTGLRQGPKIDLAVKDFKPKPDEDKMIQGLCKSSTMIVLIPRWQPRAVVGSSYRTADCRAEARGGEGDRHAVQDPRCSGELVGR
jgi:hypothetical protein